MKFTGLVEQAREVLYTKYQVILRKVSSPFKLITSHKYAHRVVVYLIINAKQLNL